MATTAVSSGRRKKKPSKAASRPRFLFEQAPPPGSLDAFARGFIEYLEVKNFSLSSIKSQGHSLGYFIEWCLERGIFTPQEVGRAVVTRYQRHMYRFRNERGKPLSFRTQKTRLVHVRGFFTWLCKHHVLEHNPAFDLDLPRIPKTLPCDVMSVAEVERVLAVANTATVVGLRDRAIMETLYSTGIRRAEAANLQIFDLNEENGYLMVKEGKGRKDRVVPIGERALLWLRKYLDESRPFLVVPPDDGSLFLTQNGFPLSPDMLGILVNRYIKRSAIDKKGSTHMFRHTFATLLLEGGADIRHIQKMLGHSSLETTEIYTHVAIKQLKEVHTRTHPARMERTKTAADVEGTKEAMKVNGETRMNHRLATGKGAGE